MRVTDKDIRDAVLKAYGKASQWIPRSADDDAHWKVWMSPNSRAFLMLGGDIYGFHLQIGKLAVIAWDKD